jgi:hypothetical protein
LLHDVGVERTKELSASQQDGGIHVTGTLVVPPSGLSG